MCTKLIAATRFGPWQIRHCSPRVSFRASARGLQNEEEVVRTMDGPLAPFGDAVELAHRVRTEPRHAGLFAVFLDVRNAAAAILDHTTLADVLERNRRVVAQRGRPRAGKR